MLLVTKVMYNKKMKIMIDVKRISAEYLADFSIGPELGDNPTQQQIEELLEKKRSRVKEIEDEISKFKGMISKSEYISEISELQELILDDERSINSYEVQIEKLEGALQGKPLYTEGYLRFKENNSRMHKRWELRKKYGLSWFCVLNLKNRSCWPVFFVHN